MVILSIIVKIFYVWTKVVDRPTNQQKDIAKKAPAWLKTFNMLCPYNINVR